jgi:hypothetical protein
MMDNQTGPPPDAIKLNVCAFCKSSIEKIDLCHDKHGRPCHDNCLRDNEQYW